TVHVNKVFMFLLFFINVQKCLKPVSLCHYGVLWTPWCAPIKVKHGDVSCRSPGGEYYGNVMGSSCKIRCKKGYEMQHGHAEVVCLASKHWSGNYACRGETTTHTHTHTCTTDSSYLNSRCEFFCSPGYNLKGPNTVTCQYHKTWTSGESICVDVDVPVIKCPNLKEKTAEPSRLTARVTWDTPEGKDTADGILTDVTLKGKPPGHFPEGLHKMSYTVYDRAGNKGSCRFSVRVRVRRCSPMTPPDNSFMKCDSDGNNYGATCEFKCTGGYELQGSAARVCQYGLTWSCFIMSCHVTAMNINVGVRTASGLLDQFYEKRRLLIISAPTAANHYYRFQMTDLQHAQCGLDLRHVTMIELVGIYPAQIGRIRHRLIPPGLLLQISHNNFNMVMIDKQGMDRERYTYPITSAQIFTTIDTWQGRIDEMVQQQEAGHTCQ
uniref:Sushi-repeat containing protein X-linked n=1 Tax=Salmo trutta TaxID=8032 RepID=A0A673XAP6_SALTR